MKEYRRNGKTAYYDQIRGCLVLKTPEETVRQTFTRELQNSYHVPQDAIKLEYALNKYRGKSRKRADIVIFDGDETPIMVIECKEPTIFLLDDTLEQCSAYADHLRCKWLAVTNGTETTSYHKLDNIWKPVTAFPSFQQMLKSYNVTYARPQQRKITRLTYQQLCDIGSVGSFNDKLWDDYGFVILGEDTPPSLWPHVANLFNAVFASNAIEARCPHKYQDIVIDEVLGYRFTRYGNAGGGQFPGLYAGFRIVDSDGNDQIYRIGFFATGHTENDPTFGNRKGTSGIHVAIDNFEMSPHMSLELSFDTCLKVTHPLFTVNHDGKITVGKLGAAKKDLMLAYTKEHAPYLLGDDGQVHLGTFQLNKLLGFDDVKEFLFRIIKYAGIRDKFRIEYKKERNLGTGKAALKKSG